MKYKFLIILVLFGFYGKSQEHYMGLEIDEELYNSVPLKAQLLTRDYTVLPSSWSLKRYCPEPKSQGQHGTCTAWSTTYAGRTICEAVKNGWTNTSQITSEAFAPLFVYAHIERKGSRTCQYGTCIPDALEILKNIGVPKYRDLSVQCSCSKHTDMYKKASLYKIDDYYTLFNSNEYDSKVKIRKVKKAIHENCPVIISMEVYDSFDRTGELWNGVKNGKMGHHAMCVIGYDDNKYGGAFEIQNSWGDDWGNDGFVWVKYKDFCNNVKWAYEMYMKPAPVEHKNELSGTMSLQLSTGETVGARKIVSDLPYYTMYGEYITGTRYRVYVSNNQPAYVYILGSDDATGEVSVVFPADSHTSAALTYSSNNIAIPHEEEYIELDDTPGVSYLCVIYSADKLDINTLAQKIESQTGAFSEKVKKALADKIVPINEIDLKSDVISFSCKSKNIAVPVIMAVRHK